MQTRTSPSVGETFESAGSDRHDNCLAPPYAERVFPAHGSVARCANATGTPSCGSQLCSNATAAFVLFGSGLYFSLFRGTFRAWRVVASQRERLVWRKGFTTRALFLRFRWLYCRPSTHSAPLQCISRSLVYVVWSQPKMKKIGRPNKIRRTRTDTNTVSVLPELRMPCFSKHPGYRAIEA